MKLFTTRQIAEIDHYTMEHEPISDLDLMERASVAITDRLIRLTGRQQKLVFLAGPGNNGGDALAVARLISEAGYSCDVFLPELGSSGSRAQEINLHRLKAQAKAKIYTISGEKDFPRPEPGTLIIDGLFGSGLSRPLEGLAAELVRHINQLTSGSQETGDGPFDSLRLPSTPLRDRRSGTDTQGPVNDSGRRETGPSTPFDSAQGPTLRDRLMSGDGKREKSEILNEPNKTQKDAEEKIPSRLCDFAVKSEIKVVSLDVPSGLMGEDNTGNIPEKIIRANVTITLQFPKISLLFPENEQFVGEVFIEDIGLHPEAIRSAHSPFGMTDRETVYSMFKRRSRFSHKGDFGHALLVAGSHGKMGAALLASEACLRTGTGLVTTHLPGCGYEIQQTYMPEVMCSIDDDAHLITRLPALDPYQAIGAGPGLGTHPVTGEALLKLILTAGVPLVLDADALNILSLHPEWLPELHPGTILTPHPGEFRRLFGETPDSWQRLRLQSEKAMELKVVIVLKGAYTTVALPDGKVWFNTTGNPGMATGGSGDVLTGIILGLLAQGFPPGQAAIAGIFIHGEAGDRAASRLSQPALTASDITSSLGEVFHHIFNRRESDFSYF